MENPRHEDQRFERAAEEQRDAPEALRHKRSGGRVKAWMHVADETGEDIEARHREINPRRSYYDDVRRAEG